MLSAEKIREMKVFSKQVQMEVVKMIAGLGVGHLGGSLSITDLLSVLYCNQMRYEPKNPRWEGRDWLVLSKGHAGPALYATLALKGFFPRVRAGNAQPPAHQPAQPCRPDENPRR